VAVHVLSLNELKEERTKKYSCAGIHPWWLEDLAEDEIEGLKSHIENLLENKKLWAIGETGIDRLYPEFLDKQKELLLWHWNLAEKFQLPLIIHNVRAASDFLEILKAKKPSTPWIFHDFRGNEQLVDSLLKHHDDCYFSFGLSLDNSPQIRELITVLPLQKIFLETDDQRHLDIHDIYIRAAEQLHLDIDFLKSQIWMNFKKITEVL
jgi:TatD DNase family protein